YSSLYRSAARAFRPCALPGSERGAGRRSRRGATARLRRGFVSVPAPAFHPAPAGDVRTVEDRLRAEQRARRLALGFAILVGLTWALIALAALVPAHDAGLACPDGPRCFGVWLPEMDLQVAFEWTHRLVAGAISLAFAGLGAIALARPDTRRAARAP